MSTNSSFQGRLAFIIGGSEGIGKSLASELVKSGARVLILSRSETKLQEAVKELRPYSREPKQIQAQTLDVRDHASVTRVLDQLVADHGTPDYIFNTAGFARPGYIEELDIQHYRDMMEVNYFGTLHVCKAIAPHLVRARKGHIINTSSIAGFIGLFGYTGYCGSKFAVIGFSEALKRELAPYGVSVSVLCPPNTKTPGLEKENLHKPKEVLATEEKVKVVDPDYVARALLRSLPSRRFLVVPTFDGALANKLSRFFPSILDLFVKRPSQSPN